MTTARFEALRMLSMGARTTTKLANNEQISGRVAALLIREGLARWGTTFTHRVTGDVERYVEITPRGERALREFT
jgi:predicted transcriptional regulator